ncbi:MAG: hypothetical protein WAT79_04720 [Saprospiraceae bacterium]
MAYLTLFFWSFLAATIVPVGVEPYFIYHVLETKEMFLPCLVASTGNVMGSLTILFMGILGHTYVVNRVNKIRPDMAQKGKNLIDKYGYPLLLLSWVPFIGDILVLFVGLAKPKMIPCFVYLTMGKTVRFVFLAWTVLG